MKRRMSALAHTKPVRRLSTGLAVATLMAAFGLSGCAMMSESIGLPPAAQDTSPSAIEARSILDRLQKTNETLKNFKGIGRLTIRKDGKVQMDERLAWIGSDPLRLSVVLFAGGFPAARMAGDGEWLYYQDAEAPNSPVKKVRASDPDFKRLLSIPIQSSDILALMRGRIPIREYGSARLQPLASGKGFVLLLMRTWGVQQKIFLDESKSGVTQTEVYDSSGNLLFQANFLEMQLVDGYMVPLRLAVSNDDKVVVQLLVERYWADVPVTPSMFVLGSPG
jgi:hypothetical protein